MKLSRANNLLLDCLAIIIRLEFSLKKRSDLQLAVFNLLRRAWARPETLYGWY